MMRIPATFVAGFVLAVSPSGQGAFVPPDAEFDATPLSGSHPLQVAFSDLSTGDVASWDWDFGDGNGSTAQHPAHTYTVAGTYTVVLTVDGASGPDTETKVDFITVTEPPPVADFDVDRTVGDVPLGVVFSDLSTGAITSWAWDFGDGVGASTEAAPSYTYTTTGTFTVSLTVTGPGGMDTETKTALVQVDPVPVADFGADVVNGVAPLTVGFSDLSTGNLTSWSWDFGDSASSTEQNPSHAYVTPGTYTVALTVASADNQDTETKVGFVNVLDPPPVADFSGDDLSGAAPHPVAFTDLSMGAITSWDWDFGDGTTSTEAEPIHVYDTPGDYTVELTVTGPGGSDTETVLDYVTVVEPVPVADFTGTPLAGGAPLQVDFTDASTGTITSWSWDFGDGSTSDQQHPSHVYALPGTYSVELTVSGPGGMDTLLRVDYVTAEFVPPAAAFTGAPLAGQVPLEVAFTDESSGHVDTWLWDFGDGQTSSEANPGHTYTADGDYSVQLTVTGPAGTDVLTKTDYVSVVTPAPIADFSATPVEGEVPLFVRFTDQSTGGGPVTSWLWDFGDGGVSTEPSPIHFYTSIGTYSVSLTVMGPTGEVDTLTRIDYVDVTPVAQMGTMGIGQRPDPVLGIQPLTLDFDGVRVGQTSAGQQVSIRNKTAAPVQLESLELLGVDAADYSITYLGLPPPLPLTLSPGSPAVFQVKATPGGRGARRAVLRATTDTGEVHQAVRLRTEGVGPLGAEILINAGGETYFDAQAQEWSADYGSEGGHEEAVPGGIGATSDPALHQTRRYGPALAYRLAVVDPGGYVIRLHFAETEHVATGARLIDVRAEGALVLDDLDVFQEVGPDTAHMATVFANVTDGALDLEFEGVVDDAFVAAIEVRGIPHLTVTPDGHGFGAISAGSSATQGITLSNAGIQDVTIHTISFFLAGSGSPDAYSLDIQGNVYEGGPANTSYPVSIPLPVGASLPADITFAPSIEQYDSVTLQFAGNFGVVNFPLTGLGGHEGDPYLHVVIDTDPIVVDYDADGFVDVFLDGTRSHTHEPGRVLVGYDWSDGGGSFSSSPATAASLGLGDHDITLEITDDNVPPHSLSDDVRVQVRDKTDVPGILVRYYDASGSSPQALLDAVPSSVDFAEVLEFLPLTGASSVGGSFFTGDVMVRMNLALDIHTAGTYVIIPIGGAGVRLDHEGTPVTGPLMLGVGRHDFEARFAVDDVTSLPLGFYMGMGGSPFDPGPVTHDESALVPTINSMPSSGTSLGGNRIAIDGLGFFPAGSVTVHWGGTDLTQSDFDVETPARIEFNSPPGPEGTIMVTVETPVGVSNAKPFTYSASGPVPINFVHNKTFNSPQPTGGVWGPDGRFYVASLDGRIKAFTFDESYNVVAQATYAGVSGLSNSDLIGITVSPWDPPSPVRLYVGHGHHFVNGGVGSPGFSPYTGQVSILEGPNFDAPVPLITGLPVSNHDHAINGLEFDNNGDLLICVGSNTNAGVPHPNSGGLPESPLSAAILKAELSKPDFNGAVVYVDSLSGIQSVDQRDGEHVDVVPGVDVVPHATGIRNSYDLVYTTKRRLYATDNGPNNGFGAASTSATTETSDPLDTDELLLVERGLYYGSPNRARGRYEPRENVYRGTGAVTIPHQFQRQVTTLNSSTNGIIEYRSDTFSGQMRGDLLVQKWISFINRLDLSADGRSLVGFSSLSPWTGSLGLRMGPGGTLIALDVGNNEIKLLEPNDASATGLVVQDITPWRAPATGGYPFTIGGVGFGNLGNTSVTIGGLPATLTSVTSKRIRGLVPANPAPTTELLDVVVTVSGSSDTHHDAFRYLFAPGNELGTWEDLPDLPVALGEVAAEEIGGILYVLGEGSNRTLRFDLTSRTFLSDAPPRPFVGHHHAAEVFDGKLYLIGGLGGGSEGKVQIYDPVANSWSLGANMPWAAGSVSTAVINGLVYACGGIVTTFTVNNVAAYDPVLNTWSSLAVMPDGGRNHAAGGTDGEKLYVFGGRRGCNCVTNGYDDTFTYDPATDSWDWSATPGSELTPIPQRRGGMGRAVWYEGEFYVFGGETQTGAGAIPGSNVYDRVDVYDPVEHTWRLDEPMPHPRHGIYPVLYQGRIYLAGGGVVAANSQSKIFDAFTRQ